MKQFLHRALCALAVAVALPAAGQTVATPTVSLAAGSYSVPQTVAVSDLTPGSIIHYTTDGSTPTPASAVYQVPLYIFSTQTIKALAMAGSANSAIGSAAYTIAVQKTRFSLMRKSASEIVTPTPLDDRPLPSSGVEIAQIEAKNGTYSWTAYDAWIASAAANGWKLTFTFQFRPTWMSGLAVNTEGPSSDWNTATACPTVGGVVLGITDDCMWKTFMIHFAMHATGLSSQPSSPVTCPNLDYVEAGNEVDTYSGSWAGVGWSASPASFVATSNDTMAIMAKWCSNTVRLLGNLSAVVGANETSNPIYYEYEEDILSLVGAANAGLYQGVSFHTYPGRDDVIPIQPPTSNVSYSSSYCTPANTPSNYCHDPIAAQVTTLQINALNQPSTISWSGHLPIFIDEGGFNEIGDLNGDDTYGSAFISEYIPLIAAQGPATNMLYLADDSPCGSTNWGCFGVSPFSVATIQSIAWQNSATAVGACTTSAITGGRMWRCPITLSTGAAEIDWCAVQDPATCTTTTAFTTQQDIGGSIKATGGKLTLTSTAMLLSGTAAGVPGSSILTVAAGRAMGAVAAEAMLIAIGRSIL